ncbi:GspH/FimT family pseudopilin [Pseudomonas sp. MM211]|uniref:GspH/FimT family pseudopilin n=1 Tax=Pseudomonas sp. MM211 TaxID=2866808 RepID=UPI002E76897A|nr:GspH/FimT family pseudopilin [Pseudomonas sp. MM211]UCJ16992.1 GspH/FimT family pseudopilin [Pseudomonas sp. MM211]
MPRFSDSQSSNCLRAQRGFTLIELMIVIVLVGIFAAIAIPNFTQFINKNRTQSLNSELLALLQYARTTAVEQRTFIKACKGTGLWTVKKTCTDGAEALRQLDIPSGSTVSTSVSEVVFRYNGTGTEASLITCQGTDSANGFTIDVKASGSIQSWPRGKNGASSDMSNCQ